MDDLSKKFIEEANELLEKLEEALFYLESYPQDENKIDEVFRVMHTLKGSGAMFGFEELSAFTHDLESVYDRVRTGELPVTKKLIDETFHSIDLITALLNLPIDNAVLKASAVFLKKIQKEFAKDDSIKKKSPDNEPINSFGATSQKNKKLKAATWYIHFQPNEGTLKNGSRPLYLIDELVESGNCRVFLHTDLLPELEKVEAERTYCYWDFILVSAQDESHLRDVFVFVEDDSVLEIRKIDDGNWLSHPNFEEEAVRLGFAEFIDRVKLDQMEKILFGKTKGKEEGYELLDDKNLEADETLGSEEIKSPILNGGNKQPKPKTGLSSVRVPAEKLDAFLNLISEMVTVQARLEHYYNDNKDHRLADITEAYQKLSHLLRENALEMRLIPFYTLLTRFKRLVRDLSEELNKNVQFVTSGTETELDKSMIENLYDPIMHILRNSIDHGIESPEARIKAGKGERGLLKINTYNSGANVVIEISDDGKGMDVDEIRKKAAQKGWLQEKSKLSDKEILNFVFRPGFSTAGSITDVSGRGVGMDVVKKNIAELRGDVELTSHAGQGTTVTIILPLTLSIIDGLLVYIGQSRYIIPLDNVKQVYALSRDELKAGFNHVVVKDKRQIPFVNLAAEFNESESENQRTNLIILYYEEKEMAFVINDIVGNYQAVIKPLSSFIQQKEIFSGATVLGDGEVALVLDTNRIINQFINE